MRLLLVEDEPHVARFIAKGLREQAYAVDIARLRGLLRRAMAVRHENLCATDLALNSASHAFARAGWPISLPACSILMGRRRETLKLDRTVAFDRVILSAGLVQDTGQVTRS